MKFRWLAAIGGYLVASGAVLFARWPESPDPDLRSDWDLLRVLASAENVVDMVRVCWMILLLLASALVWLSACRGIRAGHAELGLALALGAAAYPFASFPEPGCPSTWVGSSAAAFVVTFAGVLAWRALRLQRSGFVLSPRGSTPLL